jgi:hypothetical protein
MQAAAPALALAASHPPWTRAPGWRTKAERAEGARRAGLASAELEKVGLAD